MNMTGQEYEKFCAGYLRKHGYTDIEMTKATGDNGVDIIARKGKEKYAVQCKYYSKNVGNAAVQEAYSGARYYRCDRAVVMTNAEFTAPACELAAELGVSLMPGIVPKRGLFGYNYADHGKDYERVEKKRERVINSRTAHTKKIPLPQGMREFVKMYPIPHKDDDELFRLRSEPFRTKEEAEHFAAVFDDCFLYDAECKEGGGGYVVLTEWLIRFGFYSYAVASGGKYYEFANWS